MMEPSEHRERDVMDNMSDLRLIDQTQDDVVSLSRLRVNVRRQDSSMAKEVYLGKFRPLTIRIN